jgi:hypothetical protein
MRNFLELRHYEVQSAPTPRSCTRVRYHREVCTIIGGHCGEFGRRGMSLQRLRKYVRGV